MYSIILKTCGLYSFHSSVPHPIHTHTCNQILYLSHEFNFPNYIPFLACACGKKNKNRNKPNGNRRVSGLVVFPFFRSFPPILTSLELESVFLYSSPLSLTL